MTFSWTPGIKGLDNLIDDYLGKTGGKILLVHTFAYSLINIFEKWIKFLGIINYTEILVNKNLTKHGTKTYQIILLTLGLKLYWLFKHEHLLLSFKSFPFCSGFCSQKIISRSTRTKKIYLDVAALNTYSLFVVISLYSIEYVLQLQEILNN